MAPHLRVAYSPLYRQIWVLQSPTEVVVELKLTRGVCRVIIFVSGRRNGKREEDFLVLSEINGEWEVIVNIFCLRRLNWNHATYSFQGIRKLHGVHLKVHWGRILGGGAKG